MNRIFNDKDNNLLSRLITGSFEKKSSLPHVLIELSIKELRRLQDNSIHLEGLCVSETRKTIVWTKVTYGSNVKLKKKSPCSEGNVIYDELFFTRMKYSRLIITASKEECMNHMSSLITSMSTNHNDPSGVVVLLAST